MNKPEEDAVWGAVNRLVKLVDGEDDRGVALSMTAFAEDCLGRLLLSYLRPGRSAKDLLLGFNAPLGTFSARIKTCFALGLTSTSQHSDLELARKIRNEFAHNWVGCSFANPKIDSLLKNMSDRRHGTVTEGASKVKFEAAMSWTMIELEYLRSTIERDGRGAKSMAIHIRLGEEIAPI